MADKMQMYIEVKDKKGKVVVAKMSSQDFASMMIEKAGSGRNNTIQDHIKNYNQGGNAEGNVARLVVEVNGKRIGENMNLSRTLESYKKLKKVSEASVKGEKINYEEMQKELVSTAYHFIKGLNDKNISFEYNADSEKGKIFFKNMSEVPFTTGNENVWLEGAFKDVSLKGALTALTVVEKMVELDKFTSKAR